jgi:hypothetical protein
MSNSNRTYVSSRFEQIAKFLIKQSGKNEAKADPKTCVTDLAANMMHFCHEKNIDFVDVLRVANIHFVAEGGTNTKETQELIDSIHSR